MAQRQPVTKVPAEVTTAARLLLARRDKLGEETDSELGHSHQAGIDEALACLWRAVIAERDGAGQ